jgi:two-component sensor histidine kinase
VDRDPRTRLPAALSARLAALVETFNASPAGVLTAGVLFTVLFFFAAGWVLWHTNITLARIGRDELRIQQLSGTIVHIDEVLTMSARMAVATGDPQWEQRYRIFEPQLEAAIAEAVSLAPESAAELGATATDNANKALVALENRAFDLVRQGDTERAAALLSGDAYAEQKEIYAAGVEVTMGAIRQRIDDELSAQRQLVFGLLIAGFLSLALLLLAWLAVLTLLRRHLAMRRRAHDELDHRVKNTLAVIQSVADLTFAASSSLDEFYGTFRGRLSALARMHTAMRNNDWSALGLRELVEMSTDPYRGAGERVSINGEAVAIEIASLRAVGLSLHELATNAAKYGALSTASGTVDVSWRVDAGEDGRRVQLSWTESGGPPVVEPRRRGFGSRFIEDAVQYELGGEVRLSFPESGVQCTMMIPLEPLHSRS